MLPNSTVRKWKSTFFSTPISKCFVSDEERNSNARFEFSCFVHVIWMYAITPVIGGLNFSLHELFVESKEEEDDGKIQTVP